MVGVVRRLRSGSVGDGRAVVLDWSRQRSGGCPELVGNGRRFRWSAVVSAAGVAVADRDGLKVSAVVGVAMVAAV